MKKILLFAFLAIFTLTFFAPDTMGQSRGKKKHWAKNVAIVGGGALIGGLLGGKKGAAIGAGTGLLVASSRKGTKKRYGNSKWRRAAQIGGGGLVGGGIGAFAGRKGAVVGSLAGAGVTYLFTRNGNRYYRARNGQTFYYKNGQRRFL